VGRIERALQTLSTEDPDEEVARVEAQLGRYLMLQGQQEAAAPHLERALTLAEGFGLSETFAQALISKSLMLLYVSRFRESEILLRAALEIAAQADLPGPAARALNNLAVVYESLDRYADAIAATEQALEFLKRTGDRVSEKSLKAGSISTFVLLGRWDEAYGIRAELEGPELVEVGDVMETVHIVEIACSRGRVAEARAEMERYPESAQSEDPQVRTSYVLHEAMIARMDGNPHRALEIVDREVSKALEELGISFLTTKLLVVEGLEAAFELGDTAKVEELLAIVEHYRPGERPPLLNAHAARFRARLAGSASEAEQGFVQATEIFLDHGLVFWRAVTQVEHAEWLLAQSRASDAEPLLAEAREIFEQLEAQPWVERVEALGGTEARRPQPVA
jgi:tetratricopeptide (TPR) repeat protein